MNKLTPNQAKAVIDALQIITNDNFDEYSLNALVNSVRNQVDIDTMYDEIFRPHIKYEVEINDKPLSDRDIEVIRHIWESCVSHFKLD